MINHASYLDALVMGEAFLPCGLAKVGPAAAAASPAPACAGRARRAVQSAVTNIPAVGTLAKALQFLLVERRDTDDAKVQNSHRGSVTALIHERAQDPRCGPVLPGSCVRLARSWTALPRKLLRLRRRLAN